ncbi:hypothetical protein NW759_005873 [Fusarium solani]|nr:hypothetical protein NW759_005873 [Fusarium solani]
MALTGQFLAPTVESSHGWRWTRGCSATVSTTNDIIPRSLPAPALSPTLSRAVLPEPKMVTCGVHNLAFTTGWDKHLEDTPPTSSQIPYREPGRPLGNREKKKKRKRLTGTLPSLA